MQSYDTHTKTHTKFHKSISQWSSSFTEIKKIHKNTLVINFLYELNQPEIETIFVIIFPLFRWVTLANYKREKALLREACGLTERATSHWTLITTQRHKKNTDWDWLYVKRNKLLMSIKVYIYWKKRNKNKKIKTNCLNNF